MVKVNLENPFLARPKSVKIGRSYWQAQSKAPTILKQKDKWVKQQNDKNYKAFRNYLQTEGARALNREVKDYLTTSNDNTWTSANRNPKNPHLQARATKGAKSHALWEKEHPVLNAVGSIAGAAPLAVAAAPLGIVASDAAGPTIASGLANPYVDAALTSTGIADVGNSFINGEIKTPYDGAIAALELAPIYKSGVTRLDKAVRRAASDINSLRYIKYDKAWNKRALIDAIVTPMQTAKALGRGDYIYNKRLLINAYRRAKKEIEYGYKGADDYYNNLLGSFYYNNPKTKMAYTTVKKVSAYNPTTHNIRMGFTHMASNIKRSPLDLIETAAHEKTHFNNDLLNHTFGTENLGYFGDLYYEPNVRHPIAAKYAQYFKNASLHGRYPEETWANVVSYKVAHPNASMEKALRYSNKLEEAKIPIEFIDDYSNYLKTTYTPDNYKKVFINK